MGLAANTSANRIKDSTHATIYAFDAMNGKELWYSGDAITSFVHFGALSIANGRMYLGASIARSTPSGFPGNERTSHEIIRSGYYVCSLRRRADGRTLDWPTFGNDAQRSGWEKSDSRFTKDDVAKGFQLLWKRKMETKTKGPMKLMPPVLMGTLVGYRGFKELAFSAGSDDSIYVMDADLDRIYWQKHLTYTSEKPKATPSAACPGITAMPTLLPIGFRRPPPRPTAASGGIAAAGPAPRLQPNPAFAVRNLYLVTTDGNLHKLNVDSGNESAPPAQVLPANANVSALNISDSVIYTTTTKGCGGAPAAVWAIDISNPDVEALPKVTSWVSNAGNMVGFSGPVIGTGGDVYVQTESALTALSPKVLEVKGAYQAPLGNVTPVVFSYKEHDLIVTAAKDGRLVVLDASSLNAPLSQTAVQAGLWGGLSTWADADGTRWVLGTIGGAKGSVVAYQLSEEGDKPVLKQVWHSRELVHPVPPVISNGVVFALSNGDGQSHATLYAIDATNGKDLWSSAGQVNATGSGTGLTVANGRVYFSTLDGTLWAFGIPLEW